MIENLFNDACYEGNVKKMTVLFQAQPHNTAMVERGIGSAIYGHQPQSLAWALDQLDDVSPTILSLAILSDQPDLVKIIISSGKIEIAVNHLRYAIVRRNSVVFELLIENSVINLRKHFKTLLALAQDLDLTNIVEILQKHYPAAL